MRFRPCIDIHNGKVKQIVGSSLSDAGDFAVENYVAPEDAAHFARMFREDELTGGHVIILNGKDSPYYEASAAAAKRALAAYPGGLAVGGGITPENADAYLDAGASEVIVTSYLFEEKRLSMNRLEAMEKAVGSHRLIIDLSCAPYRGQYHVMCDRWQTRTETVLDTGLFARLAPYCHEFLLHGIAAEGRGCGVDAELLALLAGYPEYTITYAGGVRSLADIALIEELGQGRIDYTVGSALDIYGGTLSYRLACKTTRPRV